MPFQEVKKRARILVVDDDEFPYMKLFQKNGYAIEHWPDVEDLDRIERGGFDLILLDIQGVGREISRDQGAGVLRHIKSKNPSQIVVAYSNADFSLRYQEFFSVADASLQKSSDYSSFQLKVDELLERRFTIDFYLDLVVRVSGKSHQESKKIKEVMKKLVVDGDRSSLEKVVSGIFPIDAVPVVVSIVNSAISVYERMQG